MAGMEKVAVDGARRVGVQSRVVNHRKRYEYKEQRQHYEQVLANMTTADLYYNTAQLQQ